MHVFVVAVAVCVASRGGCAWVRLVCSCVRVFVCSCVRVSVVCLDVLRAVIFRLGLGASRFLPVVFARCASPNQ